MRTTLDLEEDVLLAVKEIARMRGQSIGKVLSDLARKLYLDKMPGQHAMVCRSFQSSLGPV